MKVVTVIPLQKGVFKENLTYFSSKTVQTGDVVEINIRKKNALALVIGAEDLEEAKSDIKRANFNLRKIIAVKERSIFRSEYIDSILSASNYFASKHSDTMSTLVPAIFKEEYDKTEKLTFQNLQQHQRDNLKSEKLLLQDTTEGRYGYYKTLIRSSFAQKKSVFIILPTYADIENLKKQLKKGVDKFTFVLHSKESKKKLMESIKEILTSEHPVLILGTAPYLAINRKDISTIIVERENSIAYRTLSRPYLDLRIFAEIFASRIGAKFILADTLLRYETLVRKDTTFSSVHSVNFRYKLRINFDVIDANTPPEGKFKVLKDETLERITKALERKKNVFVFTLRKGLATETICRDCGNSVLCADCTSPLVLYKNKKGDKRIFMCNRCNKEKSPETLCSHCGSWNLYPLGIGVDTVVEELKKTFPNRKIYKVDKEHTSTATKVKKEIEKFEKEKNGAILVGTQLAFPYFNEKIPLTVIASLDSLWSIPNFRITEKVLWIIFSMIENTKNVLMLQTKNLKEELLKAVKKENLSSYVKGQLKERANLEYPPYKRFIKIIHLGDQEDSEKARDFLKSFFKDYSPIIFPGFPPKIKGKYVTNALIKKETYNWSLPELDHNIKTDQKLLDKLLSLPPSFSVQVDPDSLL